MAAATGDWWRRRLETGEATATPRGGGDWRPAAVGAAGLRPGSLASGEGWRRRCGLRPAGVGSRVAGVGGRAPGLSPACRWPGRLTPGRRVRVDRLRE